MEGGSDMSMHLCKHTRAKIFGRLSMSQTSAHIVITSSKENETVENTAEHMIKSVYFMEIRPMKKNSLVKKCISQIMLGLKSILCLT